MKKVNLLKSIFVFTLSFVLLFDSTFITSASAASTNSKLASNSSIISKLIKNRSTFNTSVAYNFIKDNYSIDHSCTWTKDTKVKEAIPTYDLENNITGYILNLFTNGMATGYIVYDISASKPVVLEFGYLGSYSIEGESVTSNSRLGKLELISDGIGQYYVKNNNDLYTAKDNIKVTAKKASIQQSINNKEKSIAASAQVVYTINPRVSTLQATASSTSNSLPNLWQNGYYPVYISMYSSYGCCGVVCGLNMLKYWHVCRGINSLYNSYDEGNNPIELLQTFNRLWYAMDATNVATLNDPIGSTTVSGEYNGIDKYCSTYACNPPKGGDIVNGYNWSWYKTNINNGNFTCVDAYVDSSVFPDYHGIEKGYHAFSGVGYEEQPGGYYMRVGDQWDASYSHFYNASVYNTDILAMWYKRW